jgi:hypothetical protein
VSGRRLEPPGGEAPPTSAWVGEAELDLAVLAREICRRYRQEFPDERERYGDAGLAWCVHDTQYLLHWGAEDVDGVLELRREVGWLARVLEARDFPAGRLARNLEIAAEVILEELNGEPSELLAAALADAAAFLRSAG